MRICEIVQHVAWYQRKHKEKVHVITQIYLSLNPYIWNNYRIFIVIICFSDEKKFTVATPKKIFIGYNCARLQQNAFADDRRSVIVADVASRLVRFESHKFHICRSQIVGWKCRNRKRGTVKNSTVEHTRQIKLQQLRSYWFNFNDDKRYFW